MVSHLMRGVLCVELVGLHPLGRRGLVRPMKGLGAGVLPLAPLPCWVAAMHPVKGTPSTCCVHLCRLPARLVPAQWASGCLYQ